MSRVDPDRQPMLKSHSSSSSLLLDGSSPRPGGLVMRNWPLFVFLSCLVFFFYVFYIYQATSTELSLKTEQLEIQYKQAKILRDENLEIKADLEKLKQSESSLKSKLTESENNFNECQTSLRSIKLKSDSLNDEKNTLDNAKKVSEKEATEFKDKLANLEKDHSSLQQLFEAEKQLTQQLNTTVAALQGELNTLKGAQAQTAAQQQQPAAGVPATTAAAAAPVAGANGQQQQPGVPTTTAGKKPDLGELINQDKAADANAAGVAGAAADTLNGVDARAEKEAIENGEKPDPNAKPDAKPDGLRGEEIREDGEVVDAKEDREPVKEEAGEGPGQVGDRVKMEEGLMDADKPKPAVQGGDYMDKDDADNAAAGGAIDAPIEKRQQQQ